MRNNKYSRFALGVLMLATLGSTSCSRPEVSSVRLFISPTVFDLGDGKSEFAERGYLFVPENRNKLDSAEVGVHFMRFRSTSAQPGAAIFIMAGGPGGSWIPMLTEGTQGIGDPAKGNFQLALAILEDLRSAADVVVIDQRGAGLSVPQMDCPNHQRLAASDKRFSASEVAASFGTFARECKQAWAAQGRDLDGYHALELADDIDDLRRALGYGKISLLGGSFGSEWGLVTLRRHPEMIERVAWHGMEGIQHTWDSPTGILTSITTILAQAERDPDLAPHVPAGGFLTAIQRRIEELDRAPVTVSTKDPVTGETVQVVIGSDELRQAWRAPVNRNGTQAWPGSLVAVLEGDLSVIAERIVKSRDFNPRPTGNYLAMGAAIDCGLSPAPERRRELANDPAAHVLGDINLHYTLCDEWQARNIPSQWLEVLHSDVPALFMHGTWDLSTPLQNARDIAAGFPNGHLLVVEGGTHGVFLDLYREQPQTIRPLIRRFFAGQPLDGTPDRVSLPAVRFSAPTVYAPR